jgi:uncharacterized membrane protein HdeD (DUF308 family)
VVAALARSALAKAVEEGCAMVAFARAWWVAMMRGVAALTIALFVLVQPHISMTRATVALGAYILADSVIIVCGVVLGVIATGLGVCGALLLAESLVGMTVALASLSETHTAPYNVHAAQVPIIARALVSGLAEVWISIQIGRRSPAFQETQDASDHSAQASFSPERAYLLAGAVALAFALALFALPMTSAGVAIPILGLFTAAFGYLHLRGGLALGILSHELLWEGRGASTTP